MAGRSLRDLRRRLTPALVAGLAAAAPCRAVQAAPPSAAAETPVETTPAVSPRPPRIDGAYVGGVVFTGVGLTRVNGLDAGPFAAFGGALRFGEMILPWLGLGLSLGGAGGVHGGAARQRLGQGQLLVDATFVPLAKRALPLSLRASFGFGAGAVTQAGESGRSGFGGAAFGGAIGYTFFPWAQRKRPFRGGGFGLGPELAWHGFPPTAAGRPMSNTISIGLTTTFYFGS